VYRAAIREHGMGKAYVKEVRIDADSETDLRTKFVNARPADPAAVVSVPRSIGLWLSAFFTLAVLSFLYRDNVFYKLSEAIFVGTTAGYLMALGFWDGIVSKLLANLTPELMRRWALPELEAGKTANYLYLVPLVLGVMLMWRLAPRGGWIGRWPLAYVVGTYAGLKLVNFLDADFVQQIGNTIVPLVVLTNERKLDVWQSLRNIGLIIGVLSCLIYFFFSFEHKGVAGWISRVGIWYLMITFGASFAFTVMGRIALLASRIDFLFDDWLWLIDPRGIRPDGW
jgi:hypothetical protein